MDNFDLDPFNNESVPPSLNDINTDSSLVGFDLQPDNKTGALLRVLVASKRNGLFLELGTGTGISTCWMLDAMCSNSKLVTIDNDEKSQSIAKKYIPSSENITFLTGDAFEFIKKSKKEIYDIIFADAWPGKFELMHEAISLLKVGGFYIVDDMLPYEDWPEEQYPQALENIKELLSSNQGVKVGLEWSTGICILTKTSN
ncbi:class I SAM-dependent methyltransferase [Aliivibrio fischeri]|uniref:O-methyltransferase n=1 Tax=Aliivibrio fischeri TaxID=668 RepID=UPI001F39D672|nr:class I SAM-dependent methyltransferase [Aliivibrio fischeri]MCE7578149.1 class I SAM-dependent methyltransferase [Aliivibrio fischeri]MCE7590536.1 class I SAM-dependent methyltransferase [Aliivibrio fischeri]